MKNAMILYRFLPQYREDFYNKLRAELAKQDVNLRLIYGKSKNVDSLKKDEIDLEWAEYAPNRVFKIGGTELIWQSCFKKLKGNDLIIVEQANKLLLNYYLMFARNFFAYKFALWGHGRNLQDKPNSLKNRFKFLFLKKCDWWFAYTKGVKEMLVSFRFPESKITVVQNAIDTKTLQKHYSDFSMHESEELKKSLGISGKNIAIYCGGMYREKRLDMIIDTCLRVKEKIEDFHMIFIGSGAEAYKAKDAGDKYDFIHYLGPKFGADRVKYFKIASVQLMPGLVGLGILDSFALETPIITTAYHFHSPEIEYLESEKNGIITKDDPDVYAETVTDVFKNMKYNALIEGCKNSAHIYTVEKMVNNFKEGILRCLG